MSSKQQKSQPNNSSNNGMGGKKEKTNKQDTSSSPSSGQREGRQRSRTPPTDTALDQLPDHQRELAEQIPDGIASPVDSPVSPRGHVDDDRDEGNAKESAEQLDSDSDSENEQEKELVTERERDRKRHRKREETNQETVPSSMPVWLSAGLAKQTQDIADRFDTGFNALSVEVKKNTQIVAKLDERVSATEMQVTELKKAYEETIKLTKELQRQIDELKKERMVQDAASSRAHLSSAPMTFSSSSARSNQSPYGHSGGQVDRNNNIYGTWKWAPSSAVQKQLRHIIEVKMRQDFPDDKVYATIDNIQTSQPRCNYAFIMYKGTDEQNPRQIAWDVKQWLLRHPQQVVGGNTDIWTQPCRPEHERCTRSILNTCRSFLHTERDSINMGKKYLDLGSEVDVISGSYRAGSESVTWKNQLVATLTEPEGVKTLSWVSNQELIDAFSGDFVEFDPEAFNRKWHAFLNNRKNTKA